MDMSRTVSSTLPANIAIMFKKLYTEAGFNNMDDALRHLLVNGNAIFFAAKDRLYHSR